MPRVAWQLYVLSTIHHPSYAHTLLRIGRVAEPQSLLHMGSWFLRSFHLHNRANAYRHSCWKIRRESDSSATILPITRSNGQKLHALLSLAVSSLCYVSWPYMRLRVGSTLVTIRLLPLSPNNEIESSVRIHLISGSVRAWISIFRMSVRFCRMHAAVSQILEDDYQLLLWGVP